MYFCVISLLSQLAERESVLCITNRTSVLVAEGDLYLQSTASGHGLVRVQGGAQLFAEEFADSLLDGRDSGGTTDDLHCVDVFLFQLWIQEAGDTCHAKQRLLKFRQFPKLS